MWATFLFTLVILCVTDKTTRSTADGGIASLLIISALWLALMIAGPMTGGCINPSVGFNLLLWGKILDNKDKV